MVKERVGSDAEIERSRDRTSSPPMVTPLTCAPRLVLSPHHQSTATALCRRLACTAPISLCPRLPLNSRVRRLGWRGGWLSGRGGRRQYSHRTCAHFHPLWQSSYRGLTTGSQRRRGCLYFRTFVIVGGRLFAIRRTIVLSCGAIN